MSFLNILEIKDLQFFILINKRSLKEMSSNDIPASILTVFHAKI